MECFNEYNPIIWTLVLLLLTLIDVTYFIRHIWVAIEVLLKCRPLYNAAIKYFNRKFDSYIREHDLKEEDIFESRVYPHEVDHALELTDHAGAMILELSRNRTLYGTGMILVCWETATSLWVVSTSQVTWRRRPKLLEKYTVRTIFTPDYENLHSRYMTLKQVMEAEEGGLLCEALVTLALPHDAQVGTLIGRYRDTFGEPCQKEDKEKSLMSLFFGKKKRKGIDDGKEEIEDISRAGKSKTEEGDTGWNEDHGLNRMPSEKVKSELAECGVQLPVKRSGLKKSKSYGNFVGTFSDLLQESLSGIDENE